MCPSFSQTTALKFVDDLLVEILPAGVHSVFEIVQAVNRSAIHAPLQSPHIQRNQPGSSPGYWGHTDGLINFHKTFFFVYERHSMCKQCVSLMFIVFLLDLGSFTNLVICICVLKIQTIKLAHTQIDCFLTCNNQFCFYLKEN